MKILANACAFWFERKVFNTINPIQSIPLIFTMCLAVHLRFQLYRPALSAFVGAHFRFHHHHHLHSFIVKSKISHFKIGEIRFILIQFILFFIQEYLSFKVPFCRMTFKLVYRSQFAVANPKI